jgi:SNF2 family DNA or RNA helicase
MSTPHLAANNKNQLVVLNCYEERQIVKNLGAKWDGNVRAWVLAFTIDNLNAILEAIPHMTISNDLEARAVEQEKREKEIKDIKRLAAMDADTDLVIPGLRDGISLRPFQKLGVKFSVAAGSGAMIADSPGLGKTIQAIATALILKDRGLIKNCLVIAPASLKYNWPIEIAKFTQEKYVIIDGTPEQRIGQWMSKDAFFFISNYELLQEDFHGGRTMKKKDEESPEELARRIARAEKSRTRMAVLDQVSNREWGLVVVDEIHAIKGKSARSSNVKAVRGKFRLGLSGTPLDGRLEELHSVMEFIVPGLLGSRTKFLQRHAITDFWGAITGYQHVDEVKEKIAPFYIRRLKQDVLKELPSKIYQNIVVTLNPHEKTLYRQLANRKHEITEDAEAFTAILRCKQFCDHPGLIGLSSSGGSKLAAFRNVIEEVVVDNRQKALVFTQYKSMIPYITPIFDELKLKFMVIDGDTNKSIRAAMQEKYNQDETISIMIGTEAMSTGLNFQSADYVINFDDNWSPAYMLQREDRAHRMGREQVVNVVNFICHDTIEERIRQVLTTKNMVSADVLGDNVDEMVLSRMNPKDVLRLL